MIKGTVKWYDQSRGFGFIEPQVGGEAVFVHATALQSARIAVLKDGQRVQFDLTPSKNGKAAVKNLLLSK